MNWISHQYAFLLTKWEETPNLECVHIKEVKGSELGRCVWPQHEYNQRFDKDNNKNATIVITEGKYHQVKKMCKSVGKTVNYLKRIKVNKLILDKNLKPGEYRELTEEEIDLLK